MFHWCSISHNIYHFIKCDSRSLATPGIVCWDDVSTSSAGAWYVTLGLLIQKRIHIYTHIKTHGHWYLLLMLHQPPAQLAQRPSLQVTLVPS